MIYNPRFDGLCEAKKLSFACQLVKGMLTNGVIQDVFMYASLLDHLCKSVRLDEAVAILGDMENNRVEPKRQLL